jgi:hypothetical protein
MHSGDKADDTSAKRMCSYTVRGLGGDEAGRTFLGEGLICVGADLTPSFQACGA